MLVKNFKTKAELELAVRDGFLGHLLKGDGMTETFRIETLTGQVDRALDGHTFNYMRDEAMLHSAKVVYFQGSAAALAKYKENENSLQLNVAHDPVLLETVEKVLSEYRPDVKVNRVVFDKKHSMVQYVTIPTLRFEREADEPGGALGFYCHWCGCGHENDPQYQHRMVWQERFCSECDAWIERYESCEHEEAAEGEEDVL